MRKLKIAILISIVSIGLLVLVTLWVNLKEKKASEKGEEPPKISTDGADARLEKIRFVEDNTVKKHGSWRRSRSNSIKVRTSCC